MTATTPYVEGSHQSTPTHWLRLWDWLTEPAAEIEAPETRYRARLLSLMLLLAAAAAPLIHLIIGAPVMGISLPLIAIYAVSRTAHYRSAVACSLIVISMPSLMALITMEDYSPNSVFLVFVWLTLPLLLGVLMLDFRGIALLSAGLFVAIAVLTALIPALTLSVIIGPLGYVGVTLVLVVLAGMVRRQYLDELNRQLGELRRAQNHLQDARAELEQRIEEQGAQATQLGQLNERMAAILHSSSDAIILADPEGAVHQTNRAFDVAFGYGTDETFGCDLTTMVETQCVERLTEALHSVAATGQPCRVEVRAQRKDGTVFDADASLSPITSRRNEMWGIVCSLRDITQRKQIEDLLRTNERRFRALFDQTHDAVFILDLEGNHVAANRKAADVLGYTPEEVIGLSFRQIIAPSELDKSLDVLGILHAGGTIPMYERTFRKKSGQEFPVEITVEMVRDASGKPMHIQSVVRDITRRKRSELALREALAREKELGELKSRFVSMASHEFRTPLATIQATSDALRHYSSKMTEDQIIGRFDKIQSQIKHMTSLLDDVLVLGHMQSGRKAINPEPVALGALCHEILDELQTIYGETHAFSYSSEEPELEVAADRKLLRQIITNLLSNGAKYSPAGSTVALHLSRADHLAVLRVSDSGIGIPEEDRAYLFEAFHRATNASTIAGTGLGLAITKHAVELHGGTITFESELEVGTTFTITLPLEQTESKQA